VVENDDVSFHSWSPQTKNAAAYRGPRRWDCAVFLTSATHATPSRAPQTSSWEMVPSSRSTSRRLRTTSALIPGSRVPCQDVATSNLATTYAHEVTAGRPQCQPTHPGGTSPPDRVGSRLARPLDARFPAPVTYAANRASSFLGRDRKSGG